MKVNGKLMIAVFQRMNTCFSWRENYPLWNAKNPPTVADEKGSVRAEFGFSFASLHAYGINSDVATRKAANREFFLQQPVENQFTQNMSF